MKYYSPESELELLKMISTTKNYYILNGGTDLIVQQNEQMLEDYPFIDISKIEELNYIKEDCDNIYVGANVKYYQMIENKLITKYFNSLIMVADEIGSAQIRGLGTMTGNIANASPGGDSPVVLENLDASVKIKSIDSEVIIPIDDFVTGFRENSLQPKQYISEIIIPKKKTYSFFKKYGLGHKEKVIIANVSIAISFNIVANKLKNVKTTFGACDVKFRNIPFADKYLENKSISELKMNDWLQLVDKVLKDMTNDFFYDMKSAHLQGCAYDTFEYIKTRLEVQ